ncbi:hypothetical protein A3Q56_03175 [Intoshia linei]|uniref:Crossover junction endonuclease MUS81 n=1 Tax=Intoshia linei TaxID=1819745 RepID=A0A177B5V3_9BILA|nr:hypothetical protein A3Q56_03175 [Intoshia linei]
MDHEMIRMSYIENALGMTQLFKFLGSVTNRNKAYNSILKYPMALNSGKECYILRGFGKKTCEYIDKKLEEYVATSGHHVITHPNTVLPNVCSQLNETSSNSNIDDILQKCDGIYIEKKEKGILTNIKYCPQYKSGVYGLLIALFGFQQRDLKPFKKDLIDRAQSFSTASYTKPSRINSLYTAWSSCRDLIRQGYVEKSFVGRLCRFNLTIQGIELCEKMFNLIDGLDLLKCDDNFCVDTDKSDFKKMKISISESLGKPHSEIKRMEPSTSSCEMSYSKNDSNSLKKCYLSQPTCQTPKSCNQIKCISSSQNVILDENEQDDLNFFCSNEMDFDPYYQDDDSIKVDLECIEINSDSDSDDCIVSQIIKPETINTSNKLQSTLQNLNSEPFYDLTELQVNKSIPQHLPGFEEIRCCNFKIVLIVDNMEFCTRSENEKKIVLKELEGISYDFRKLEIGDFLWIAVDQSTRMEYVLEYIIERKRVDDLVKSILNGRFHEQKFRLKTCGLPKLYYLVEQYKRQHVNLSLDEGCIKQALINTAIIDNFVIIETQSLKDTYKHIAEMDKIITEYYKNTTLVKSDKIGFNSENNDNIKYVSSFEQFSKKSSKSKNLTVGNMWAIHLIQIFGVSFDKVSAIVNIYPTLQSLINAYKECDSIEQMMNLVSSIRYGPNERCEMSFKPYSFHFIQITCLFLLILNIHFVVSKLELFAKSSCKSQVIRFTCQPNSYLFFYSSFFSDNEPSKNYFAEKKNNFADFEQKESIYSYDNLDYEQAQGQINSHFTKCNYPHNSDINVRGNSNVQGQYHPKPIYHPGPYSEHYDKNCYADVTDMTEDICGGSIGPCLINVNDTNFPHSCSTLYVFYVCINQMHLIDSSKIPKVSNYNTQTDYVNSQSIYSGLIASQNFPDSIYRPSRRWKFNLNDLNMRFTIFHFDLDIIKRGKCGEYLEIISPGGYSHDFKNCGKRGFETILIENKKFIDVIYHNPNPNEGKRSKGFAIYFEIFPKKCQISNYDYNIQSELLIVKDDYYIVQQQCPQNYVFLDNQFIRYLKCSSGNWNDTFNLRCIRKPFNITTGSIMDNFSDGKNLYWNSGSVLGILVGVALSIFVITIAIIVLSYEVYKRRNRFKKRCIANNSAYLFDQDINRSNYKIYNRGDSFNRGYGPGAVMLNDNNNKVICCNCTNPVHVEPDCCSKSYQKTDMCDNLKNTYSMCTLLPYENHLHTSYATNLGKYGKLNSSVMYNNDKIKRKNSFESISVNVSSNSISQYKTNDPSTSFSSNERGNNLSDRDDRIDKKAIEKHNKIAMKKFCTLHKCNQDSDFIKEISCSETDSESKKSKSKKLVNSSMELLNLDDGKNKSETVAQVLTDSSNLITLSDAIPPQNASVCTGNFEYVNKCQCNDSPISESQLICYSCHDSMHSTPKSNFKKS